MQKYSWKQFSSNHSSGFTVAGMFITTEQAKRVMLTIQDILKAISAWYEQHGYDQISPLEYQFAEQYGLTICPDNLALLHGSDAFWGADDIEHSVTNWDRLVCVNTAETRIEPTVHRGLMYRLGATESAVSWWGEFSLPLRLWLSCTAPNEETAVSIADRVRNYLDIRNSIYYHLPASHIVCPWSVDGSADDDAFQGGDEWSMVLQGGVQLRFDMCCGNIEAGLPALIQYLQVQGCTTFDYYIQEQQREEPEELP